MDEEDDESRIDIMVQIAEMEEGARIEQARMEAMEPEELQEYMIDRAIALDEFRQLMAVKLNKPVEDVAVGPAEILRVLQEKLDGEKVTIH